MIKEIEKMKKLLAVTIMTVLLCTLLVPNVFALSTGPSLPAGLSGITSAGYLLDGEVGNETVKYDTNLPLGEIKDNIKSAPNPSGKKSTAVKDDTAADITDGFAFMLGDEIMEMYFAEELLDLVLNYDFSQPLMLPIEFDFTVHEKDTSIEVNVGEILIYLTDGKGNVLANYSDNAVEVDLDAGSVSILCEFSIELDPEIVIDLFIYSTFEGFVIINTYYLGYELGIDLIDVDFTVLFPEGFDDFAVSIVNYPPAE